MVDPFFSTEYLHTSLIFAAAKEGGVAISKAASTRAVVYFMLNPQSICSSGGGGAFLPPIPVVTLFRGAVF